MAPHKLFKDQMKHLYMIPVVINTGANRLLPVQTTNIRKSVKKIFTRRNIYVTKAGFKLILMTGFNWVPNPEKSNASHSPAIMFA